MPWAWLFMVLSIIYCSMHSAYCSCWMKCLLVALCNSAYQICRIVSQGCRRWTAEQTATPRKRPIKGWSPPRNTEAPFSQAALQRLNFGTVQSVIHHAIPSCCTSRERNLTDNNHIRRRRGVVRGEISPICKTRQWSKGKITCRGTILSLHLIADVQGGCIKGSFMLIFQPGELIQGKFGVGPSDLQLNTLSFPERMGLCLCSSWGC